MSRLRNSWAGGVAHSSILLVNTHLAWIADWLPALEDRRHAERWKSGLSTCSQPRVGTPVG